MKTLLQLENIKCGGCAGSIKKAVGAFDGVSGVAVDIEHETVELTHNPGIPLAEVKKKLASMGYPEKGSLEGLSKIAANATSYVSCAIGKMTNEDKDGKL